MDNSPRLIETRAPREPQGIVLVLHGGASRHADTPVSRTQLSVLRMVPVAGRLALAGRGRLAVFRLLNSARGWDERRTPVQDVAWALDRLRERYGDLPVCLVGHSLGGRAALLSLGEEGVRSVVALAPWVYETDGAQEVPAGRRVLVVHGDQDRVASPHRSAVVARALGGAAEVGYVRVTGGKHAMLRRGRLFDRLAADFATATLLGDTPGPPVSQVLDGQHLVEV
jgi:alpha-beta hydrolase superfamily lysophospholipase